MEDTITKTWKVADTIRNPFENLGFIVAALCEPIGIRTVKGIEDVLAPVVESPGAVMKFRTGRAFGVVYPNSH